MSTTSRSASAPMLEVRNASKQFAERIPTRLCNGYAAQVASMYTGLDLKKWY